MKRSVGEKLFNRFNILFMLCAAVIFVYPFWRVLAISLNDGMDAQKGGIYLWPRMFTLENYMTIFKQKDIFYSFCISISRTVIGTFLTILFSSLMAYGLSKSRLRGRNVINIMLVLTMFFSGGLIPSYMLYIKIHLVNNFLIYVVPFIFSAYYIFIFRSYFRSLPADLEESAKLDGANDLLVFFKIVFPISVPIFATLSLYSAVVQWNDYLTAVYFVQNTKLHPLQTLLMRIITQQESSVLMSFTLKSGIFTQKHITVESIKMATLFTAVAPILCVYPLLQKYFVKGIMVGSLKG
jgi:ABC-type sugar transport system, permease component